MNRYSSVSKVGESRPAVAIFSIVLVGLVALMDYFTGREVSFSIFYLIPITFVTWYMGMYPGVAMGVLSASMWLLADLMSDYEYSNLLIPYWNSLVRLAFFMVAVFLLSRLRVALEEEKVLSRKDYLTGLPNAKSFYELAQIEIERSKRYSRPFSLVYIDCDNFKEVNDNAGHETGDMLLSKLAEILMLNIRPTDIAARIGGDEFIVLFPETEAEAGIEITSRLRERLLQLMRDNNWPVTFSMGLATFLNPPESVKDIIVSADDIMYSVKNNGKDNIKATVFP